MYQCYCYFAHLINKVTKMYKFCIYLSYRVFWYICVHHKNQNYIVHNCAASVLFSVEVFVLCSVFCSVLHICILYLCSVCVQIVCILCAFCVYLYCWGAAYMCILYSMQVHIVVHGMIAYVCICVRSVCVCVCRVFGWGLSNSIRYPPIWLPMRVYGKNYIVQKKLNP